MLLNWESLAWNPSLTTKSTLVTAQLNCVSSISHSSSQVHIVCILLIFHKGLNYIAYGKNLASLNP
jgi:hypothetical protein